MKKNKNNYGTVVGILLFLVFLCFIGWYFSDIVIYMFLALVLSVLGSPIVRLLNLFTIKKKKIPQSLSAAIALIVIVGLFALSFYLLIPLVIAEFQSLAAVDPAVINDTVSVGLVKTEKYFKEIGILMPRDSLAEIITGKIRTIISQLNIGNIFGGTVHFAVALFVGAFSVVFMTFFSLKDNEIFFKMIKKLIPIAYRASFDHILTATKKQLIRYFSGVLIEMVIMGSIEAIICYILGVPNPLLIGLIGGLLNIVPYVGPLIGVIIGIVISITGMIPINPTQTVLVMTGLKVLGAFGFAKLLDDFFLQPLIYGKSVQAHPLEIFIVILAAAQIGGVLGMVLAVPAYSLIRIVVKEFFGQYYFKDEPEINLPNSKLIGKEKHLPENE
jgi:predicted PurR-regulated permease PerM